MLLTTDYFTPAELSGFSRESLAAAQVNKFKLSRWLPNKLIDDVQFRFSTGGGGLLQAADFRAFDVPAKVAQREGVARTRGELPIISDSIRLSEYDILRKRIDSEGPIRDAILDDAEIVSSRIAARFELARAEAIESGKVTFPEFGDGAIDFQRKATHTNVAPAVPWTNFATSTPITDLLSWVETYAASNGGREPGVILMSRRAYTLLLRSAEIRALGATLAGGPTMVSQTMLSNVLSSYGLPAIETNDQQIAKADGSAARLFKETSVMLLPSGNTATSDLSPAAPVDADYRGDLLGYTLYGTPPIAGEPEYGLATGAEQMGIFVGNFKTVNPSSLWTLSEAIGVPVLGNANLVLQAKAF